MFTTNSRIPGCLRLPSRDCHATAGCICRVLLFMHKLPWQSLHFRVGGWFTKTHQESHSIHASMPKYMEFVNLRLSSKAPFSWLKLAGLPLAYLHDDVEGSYGHELTLVSTDQSWNYAHWLSCVHSYSALWYIATGGIEITLVKGANPPKCVARVLFISIIWDGGVLWNLFFSVSAWGIDFCADLA